jgi:uncharacterized membrane protein YphA (DoxX/SURF4 family)
MAGPKQILTIFLRIGIGALFVCAALGKLSDPSAFFEQIQNYEIIPNFAASLLAWFLPSLEIILGGCLIFNAWTQEAALLLMVLLFIFTVALISAWIRNLNIECGCFGSFFERGSYSIWIGRNLTLILALTFLMLGQQNPSRSRLSSNDPSGESLPCLSNSKGETSPD